MSSSVDLRPLIPVIDAELGLQAGDSDSEKLRRIRSIIQEGEGFLTPDGAREVEVLLNGLVTGENQFRGAETFTQLQTAQTQFYRQPFNWGAEIGLGPV